MAPEPFPLPAQDARLGRGRVEFAVEELASLLSFMLSLVFEGLLTLLVVGVFERVAVDDDGFLGAAVFGLAEETPRVEVFIVVAHSIGSAPRISPALNRSASLYLFHRFYRLMISFNCHSGCNNRISK